MLKEVKTYSVKNKKKIGEIEKTLATNDKNNKSVFQSPNDVE